MGGNILVSLVSYIVFTFIDLLDPLLSVVYKLIDYVFEYEWNPYYHSIQLGRVDLQVLCKGCSEFYVLKPCITIFLAKFYGCVGMMDLINTSHEELRLGILITFSMNLS